MKIFFAVYNYNQNPNGEVAPNKHNFYATFLEELKNAGHQVVCADYRWVAKKPIPQPLVSFLRTYSPDLCVIGNYGFWDIYDYTDCPICYLDIDSLLTVSMGTIYRIRNHLSRCIFVTSKSSDVEKLKQKYNASDKQIIPIHLFPYIVCDKTQKQGNIIFYGNNYAQKKFDIISEIGVQATKKEIEEAQKVLEDFVQNPFLSSRELYNQNNYYSFNRLNFASPSACYNSIVGYKKLECLSAIEHMGLTIKGGNWNSPALVDFPILQECTAKANQYNINSFSEEVSGYRIVVLFDEGPFIKGDYLRLVEAAASDACVVLQKTPSHEKIIQDLQLLSFETKDDLIKICATLLKSEPAQRKYINKTHKLLCARYNSKIEVQKILSTLPATLHTSPDAGSLIFFDEQDFLKIPSKNLRENAVVIGKPDPAKSSTVPSKQKKQPAKGLSRKLKSLMIHLGYDFYNRYPKKTLSIYGIHIYEELYVDKEHTHIFLFCFPFLNIIKKDGKTNVHLLLLEKIYKFIKKCIKKIAKAIKTRSKSEKHIKAKKRLTPAKKETYLELRRKIQKHQKILVCLFVSRISCWTFDNLYALLENSDIFEPIIIVKPFMFNGHDAMVDYMNTTFDALKDRGYNVVKGYDESTGTFLNVRSEINPDIVFYTKYWLPQFQENFYINKFEDKITFYTSYCFDIAYHPVCMNFELNNKVDRYFMPTEIHKKMASEVMNNHASNVYVVGAPKLDVFFDKTYVPKDVWKPQTKKKKRIIWAPHHSDNFPGNLYQFNAFYELTDFMFEMAEKYKEDIQIAFKPHPMLKPYLEDKKWGKESARAYYEKWANLENGQLETGEFIDLFLTSDAMILDSISFIAEYTATNKPAFFTIGTTSRVQLNEFGGINFKVLYKTESDLKRDIERFIVDVVINENDNKKEMRTEFIEKYMLPPNGKTSAQNIYDNMLDEIQHGDKK